MNKSKEQAKYIMERIRQILWLRGDNVSGQEIANILANSQQSVVISRDWANSLKDKIFREQANYERNETYTKIIPKMLDRLVENMKMAGSIIANKDSSPSLRLSAMQEYRASMKQLSDLLLDTGKLNKVPQKLMIFKTGDEKQMQLPPEVIEAIQCIKMQMAPRMPRVRLLDEPIKAQEVISMQEPVKSTQKNESTNKTTEFPGGTLSERPRLP